jgi:competence protein ComFC
MMSKILKILFPPLCVGCKKRIEDGIICRPCRETIEVKNGFTCPMCERRLPEAKNACHPEAKFVLAAAASYQNEAVRELIHALKYQSVKTALEPLTEIINTYSQKVSGPLSLVISNCVIVPVPLHPKKERERGFNQAELITRIMNNELGITVQENNLVRTKKTKSQIEVKGYEEREKNIAGCFAIKNPEFIAGRNIILVDDVFTSGATMREAVRVLKEAGARKIIGFVVAKA